MKRNKQSTRAMRQRTTAETKARGTSKYALKVKGGKQMYGKRSRPTEDNQ